ncbi:MAG TPA: polysaccharide pyruvyl transferase family protein [Bacteroidota bacterium]|nr:polysaccharide pyruvyl transferase family protein [Bacteroidota bacterium]
MVRILKHFKNLLVYFVVEIKWFIALIYLKVSRAIESSSSSKDILLLAGADLDGGFGDDIMVKAFVSQYGKDVKIDIFTPKIIRREDYLGDYPNVGYVGGFKIGNYFYFIKVIKKYKCVAVFGADVLDGYYTFHNSADRLRLLILAGKLHIDCKLISFSINSSISPRLIALLKEVSAYCLLNTREFDSYLRLKDLLGSEDRIQLTADVAFLAQVEPARYELREYMKYKKWVTECNKNGKAILAICPNAIVANQQGLNRHLKLFDAIIQTLSPFKDSYAFVFLYHDLRLRCENKSDKDISEILYSTYKSNYECYFTQDIKNGFELKSFLKDIEFCISGRMHLGISSLTFGKLMFGISYQDKFSGLYKHLGLDGNRCSIDYMHPENAGALLKEFISNRGQFEKVLKNNINNIYSLSKKNI